MADVQSISTVAISLAAVPKSPEFAIVRVWLCATYEVFFRVPSKATCDEKCSTELEPVLCGAGSSHE